MKATFTYASLAVAVLAGSNGATAQTYVSPSSETLGSSASVEFGGGVYGSSGYHASTAEEGVLAGFGYLTRSQGEANYYNSLASINGQEAYSRFLQNREKATETYFRIQQINRSAREAQRPQPLSFERYVAVAQQQAPEPLSDREYDRAAGRLSWPAMLQTEEFAAEREALDRAYQARSQSDTGPASAFHRNVWQLAAAMEAKLKTKVGQVGTAEYLASKNFIQSLSFESQQPLVVRALAVAN